jgi:CheY-like chemotaxis protein
MAVLVAGTADAVYTARLIIGEEFEYRCAYSLEEARAELSPDLELIVCNLRLGDARAIEFLKGLREDARCAHLPVICFHAHGREISESAQRAMEAALQRFGNARFVDLFAITRSRGVSAAGAALREAVFSALQRPPAATGAGPARLQ